MSHLARLAALTVLPALALLAVVACGRVSTAPPAPSPTAAAAPRLPAAAVARHAVVDGRYAGADGAIVDGVKTYKKVAAALANAPSAAQEPYVIFINSGRYYEKLTIARPFITLIGESRDETVLTFDDAADTKRPDGAPYGTSGSASVTVRAPNFRAENLTIENGFDFLANRAKPAGDPTRLANTQAVALKTEMGSDRAVFKHVRILGYQDTLLVDSGRHYFKHCYIAGTVDFIFGAGQAVFDDCDIVSRDLGSATNNGYVTAASTQTSSPYGFLFLNCRLLKGSPTMANGSVTLGRPWHPTVTLPDGARAADPNAVGSVVFKHCYMDAHIAARGWDSMSGRDREGQTVWFSPQASRFYEYGSTGPGAPGPAGDSRRVLSADEAAEYTILNVLGGWDPEA